MTKNNITTTWRPNPFPTSAPKRMKAKSEIDPSWLPAGYTVEKVPVAKTVVSIHRHGGGFMSIDMRRRFFNPGYGKPIEAFIPDEFKGKTYTGRDWLKNIVTDACSWLEKVHADTRST